MSSTNRGIIRNVFDYYVTPQDSIKTFLDNFSLDKVKGFYDPCSGGDNINDMSFPKVLKEYYPNKEIITSDLRSDSKADYKNFDFLKNELNLTYGNIAIISNPPFDLAQEFIEKAISLKPKYVIFLLRLSFLASKKRKKFFKKNVPAGLYVLSNRPSFIPQDLEFETLSGEKKLIKKGSTDSSEYAFFVWDKYYKLDYTKTHIL